MHSIKLNGLEWNGMECEKLILFEMTIKFKWDFQNFVRILFSKCEAPQQTDMHCHRFEAFSFSSAIFFCYLFFFLFYLSPSLFLMLFDTMLYSLCWHMVNFFCVPQNSLTHSQPPTNTLEIYIHIHMQCSMFGVRSRDTLVYSQKSNNDFFPIWNMRMSCYHSPIIK